MDELSAIHIIRRLKKKWIRNSILTDFFLSATLTIILFAVVNKVIAISPFWGLAFLILFFGVFILLHRAWEIKENGIAQLLDQHYPSLEESSGLLIKANSSLNTLEKLQQQKTAASLTAVSSTIKISGTLQKPMFILLAGIILGVIIYQVPFSYRPDNRPANRQSINNDNKEKNLPQIAGVIVHIKPPAYTAKPAREQDRFSLAIEEGTTVSWELKTTQPVAAIKLIFNDSAFVSLKSSDDSKKLWASDKLIPAGGFYQVSIDSASSELYKIETIRDLPPVIHIQSPKQYTTIDFGQPEQVLSRIDMTDDYAVNEAYITATIASGSGEGVKFKEQKILLPGFSAGKQEYHLQKLLALPSLGMQPGDELYFYVKAIDNHKQETRSDIYIINLPDTAQLMSLDGLANGINLKPEYFRSQRQIIIETEQLLKDKDTISSEAFKNRSNNLGIDQKMLRLRYGKFLGEEDESGVFEGENLDALSDPANFSNADKLKDAFTDKHDNAEDASFLEPEVKKQLRATLTEMWNAELQLRTFKARDALPFEYKALRLLKDLQQKSRVYVAKTNQKTTALDLQKRLTGELDKVTNPVVQKDIESTGDPQLTVRMALSLLEQMRLTGSINETSQEALRKASTLLNEKAIQQPSLYLPSVQAMRKISAYRQKDPIQNDDILIAEQGLQRLLSEPGLMPAAEQGVSMPALSKQYFNNLQKRQR